MSEWLDDLDAVAVDDAPLQSAGSRASLPAFSTLYETTRSSPSAASSTASVRASGCSWTGSRDGEGKTFTPAVLLVGGDGEAAALAGRRHRDGQGASGHVLGEKIRIGKYRAKNGYKRHTGFRASLTQIEIESIGAGKKRAAAAKPKAEAAPKAEPPKAAERRGPRQGHAGRLRGADRRRRSRRSRPSWNRPMLEAALEYEQAHAERKGAIAALESALAEKEEES